MTSKYVIFLCFNFFLEVFFSLWMFNLTSYRFKDAVILELGSGVGLVGIVASNWVKHIFCTGKYDYNCSLNEITCMLCNVLTS